MSHAQHLVDGVWHEAAILDAVRVAFDESVRGGLGLDHLPQLHVDDLRVVTDAHRCGVEAVHAIAVEPADLRTSMVFLATSSSSAGLSSPMAPGRIDVLDAEGVIAPPRSALFGVAEDFDLGLYDAAILAGEARVATAHGSSTR